MDEFRKVKNIIIIKKDKEYIIIGILYVGESIFIGLLDRFEYCSKERIRFLDGEF